MKYIYFRKQGKCTFPTGNAVGAFFGLGKAYVLYAPPVYSSDVIMDNIMIRNIQLPHFTDFSGQINKVHHHELGIS